MKIIVDAYRISIATPKHITSTTDSKTKTILWIANSSHSRVIDTTANAPTRSDPIIFIRATNLKIIYEKPYK